MGLEAGIPGDPHDVLILMTRTNDFGESEGTFENPWRVQRLVKNLVDSGGGHLTIVFNPEDSETPWIIGSEFGREAEDSPMAGGATYGAAMELSEALDQALADL